MHPRSSSISSSDGEARASWGPRLRVLAWALFWLAALDVGANLAFAYPADVKNVNPGRLQLFFDYGRSMEGRLRRMTKADPSQTAPITLAGWYQPLKALDRPAKPDGVLVNVYGMSHASRLADALQRTSAVYSARSVAAPGATTNWAFGAYRRDGQRGRAKVAVLAIMSSTLANITSMTPMTWNVSFPLAYTQDRYVLNGGKLGVVKPPYESFEGFVATLNDPVKWQATLDLFRRYDPFYDPFLFKATPLDRSTLVRMARRARVNSRDRAMADDVLTARGYNPNSEAVQVARAIVTAFADQARREGQLPVIYLVNNYGYGDQLRRALQDTLDRQAIPFLSTDQVVSPSDPANYLPDTHFTDENDDRLALALDALITAELSRSSVR
jgi:hypothetical protein